MRGAGFETCSQPARPLAGYSGPVAPPLRVPQCAAWPSLALTKRPSGCAAPASAVGMRAVSLETLRVLQRAGPARRMHRAHVCSAVCRRGGGGRSGACSTIATLSLLVSQPRLVLSPWRPFPNQEPVQFLSAAPAPTATASPVLPCHCSSTASLQSSAPRRPPSGRLAQAPQLRHAVQPARADTTLAQTMARAYLASSSSSSTTTTTTTTTTTCLVSPTATTQPPALPPPPTPYSVPKPLAALSLAKAEDYARDTLKRLPESLSARMPLELSIVPRAHWLSRLRSGLRLLIIVLSGAVVCMLVHTLEIYRGNRYLDLRSGEIPMTWPAHTNLAPTIVLLAIAAANFLASVAILSLSLKRSFRRPIRSRDAYRIIAGSFGVILWITALVVFNLLDKASKASLGRYSCTHKNVLSNGRFQYRAVCEEQVSPQILPTPLL
jgi:hypothetical protein